MLIVNLNTKNKYRIIIKINFLYLCIFYNYSAIFIHYYNPATTVNS